MKEILSFTFYKFTDPLSLPLELYQEWIILGVIELIAFIIARRITGRLYDDGSICGHAAGSICHWIIRFIVFVGIWGITNLTIRLFRFITAHWIIFTVVLVGILAVIGIILFHSHCRRGVKPCAINSEQQKVSWENTINKNEDRYSSSDSKQP